MAGEERPLGAYGVLTGTYVAGLATALVAAARRDRLPDRIGLGDVALLGVAAHKLSRTLSKDRVTAALRAPFAEHEGEGGPGEVEERAAGQGMRRAVGELLTCPYCIGAWVAGGLTVGLVHAPRLTRTVSTVFAVLAVSDFLQVAYKASEERL